MAKDFLDSHEEERNKRIAACLAVNRKQVIDANELGLQQLVEDPWVDHDRLNAEQPALADGDHCEFLIVGAGHAGILYAVNLIEAGFPAKSIRIVETAGGFGGPWYWNRYPGLMCNTESAVYMPLLDKTGYIPKYRYGYSAEIREYNEQIAKTWNLKDKALFRGAVKKLQWDEQARRWAASIAYNRGPEHGLSMLKVHARFVFLSGGVLYRPTVPNLPGLKSFEPRVFHTARWDYNFTGGDPQDPHPELTKLQDKRVACIGTGATGIQVIPELAKWAKELYVFQRTPKGINVRGQEPIKPEEWKAKIATSDGWQLSYMENFARNLQGISTADDGQVDPSWTATQTLGASVGSNAWSQITPDKIEDQTARLLALDLPAMENLRARVDKEVRDKATAEKLKAWNPGFCYLPCFHDDYLDAFNRPNVHLIDTDGKGIEGLTENAIISNGVEYPVDLMVLGTGYVSPFSGTGSPAHRLRIEILGRDGRNMDDKWAEGVATLHGISTNGFPNLFFPGLSQAGIHASMTHPFTVISQHTAWILSQIKQEVGEEGWDRVSVEPTKEAEEDWALQTAEGAGSHAPLTAVCGSMFFNADLEKREAPKTSEEAIKAAKAAPWAPGVLSYSKILEEWRADGSLQGLQVST